MAKINITLENFNKAVKTFYDYASKYCAENNMSADEKYLALYEIDDYDSALFNVFLNNKEIRESVISVATGGHTWDETNKCGTKNEKQLYALVGNGDLGVNKLFRDIAGQMWVQCP